MSSPLMEPRPETSAPRNDATELALHQRRTAYAGLIAQHEATLMRAAWRFCPGQQDYAQDLVQDTLVRGYEAFLDGRFQEGTNARAWLLTILTNCFLTDNRRRRRIADIDIDTLIQEGTHGLEALQAAKPDQPDAALLAATLDEPLARALTSLSDELRLCVILVDMEELSYAEAADVLHIPVGTVRSRLFRARQQLHALLYAYAQEHRRI